MSRFSTARRNAPVLCPRHRVFTVEEANRTLPLLRRIVDDAVAQYRLLEVLRRKRKKLLAQGRRRAAAHLDAQAGQVARRFADLIGEVEQIGCRLQDWETGTVDFGAEYQGRPVCLCWNLQEPSVAHWHEAFAGPRHRQLIDGEFAS